MILGKIVLGALDSLGSVIRALRQIERQSYDELIYLQDSDPGSVGAKRLWITLAGVMKVRDETDSIWITIA